MQAIQVHEFGEAEQLKLEQVPCPQAQAGELLVRVAAVGVLPFDWKLRQGSFKNIMPVSFPYIPGSAIAGVVEEVGAIEERMQNIPRLRLRIVMHIAE